MSKSEEAFAAAGRRKGTVCRLLFLVKIHHAFMTLFPLISMDL